MKKSILDISNFDKRFIINFNDITKEDGLDNNLSMYAHQVKSDKGELGGIIFEGNKVMLLSVSFLITTFYFSLPQNNEKEKENALNQNENEIESVESGLTTDLIPDKKKDSYSLNNIDIQSEKIKIESLKDVQNKFIVEIGRVNSK